MFERLGYWKYLDNEETLLFKGDSETIQRSISFDKRDFAKTFQGHDGLWVAHDYATWVTQEFKNDFDKYCSANGYWSWKWHEFTVDELRAINEKVKELGWLDE